MWYPASSASNTKTLGSILLNILFAVDSANVYHACRQAKADSVPTVAYSDSFGEAGSSGTVPYYLASAFDQVYVHETGMVSFTG